MNQQEFSQFVTDSTNYVDHYFKSVGQKDRELMPDELFAKSKWVSFTEGSTLVYVHVNDADLRRIEEYSQKGWHPFPGFVCAPGSGHKAGFKIGGYNNVFISTTVQNAFSFEVDPGGSLAVWNHGMDLTDPNGTHIGYTISCALILGLNQGESAKSINERLVSLLKHFKKTWREMKNVQG